MKKYWDEFPKRSLAYHRFKKCHTELNEIYWESKLNRIMACKYSIPYEPEDELKGIGILPVGEERRYATSFREWKQNISKNESWIRRNVILSASAYLEKYIHEVTTISIMADPGVLLNIPRRIDGLYFLKQGISPQGLDSVDSFTSGDWNKRLSALKRIFRNMSILDEQKISCLEQIRKLRNKLAHRYGYDFRKIPPHEVNEVVTIESISESKLLEFLGIIESTALSLDGFLLSNHIGYFEYLFYWHKIDKASIPKRYDEDYKRFRFVINGKLSSGFLSTDKAKSLIMIYKSSK